MVLVQKWPFFQPFFIRQYRPENVFYDILEQKISFQAIKTRSKSRKIDIFLMGLIHGFSSKMAIFPTFLFQVIQTRKMSLTIFQNEKMPFQAIKTKKSKSRKIDIFRNGLTHGFCQKMAIFPTLFFRQYRPENVFYDIVE